MARIDGRWYPVDSMRNARESLEADAAAPDATGDADAAAAPATPATPAAAG